MHYQIQPESQHACYVRTEDAELTLMKLIMVQKMLIEKTRARMDDNN